MSCIVSRAMSSESAVCQDIASLRPFFNFKNRHGVFKLNRAAHFCQATSDRNASKKKEEAYKNAEKTLEREKKERARLEAAMKLATDKVNMLLSPIPFVEVARDKVNRLLSALRIR